MMQAAKLGWVAFLSVSCAPAAVPSASARVPAPRTLPTPSAAASRSEDIEKESALEKRIADALAYVSEIRGLPAKAPVKGHPIARAEIERYLSAQIDEETPKDVLEATEALLYGFGTVDASFDYRASIISLMSSQLLGFYDPKQKTFFVGGDLHGEEADVTLWHELVHALQDQHYDLSSLTEWQPDLGDAQAAVHALAEGDATSAMLDAMLKPRGVTALEVPDGLMRAQTVLRSRRRQS
jgi:hypothetical protein